MNSQELIGKIFNSWEVLRIRKDDEHNPIYDCFCKKCSFQHAVAKTNLVSNASCPTCSSESKFHSSALIDFFSTLLGLDHQKKNEISAAFDKLNKPEFQEIYSSLERSSRAIQDVMRDGKDSSDIVHKVLGVENIKLKEAFNNLIRNGKITEEEAKLADIEINSSTNIEKLKSMINVMKARQDAKKS